MTPSKLSELKRVPMIPLSLDERLLIVVARHATTDFRYLAHAFDGVHWAEVILDRRHGERRRSQESPADDRRRADRRTRPDVDSQLREAPWVVVR